MSNTCKIQTTPDRDTMTPADARELARETAARFLCESSIGQNGGPGSWEERQHYRLVWAMGSELTMGQWCREHANDLLAALAAKGIGLCGPGQVVVSRELLTVLIEGAEIGERQYGGWGPVIDDARAALSAGSGPDGEEQHDDH